MPLFNKNVFGNAYAVALSMKTIHEVYKARDLNHDERLDECGNERLYIYLLFIYE